MHDLTIITTLIGALAAALALGWLTQRAGLSPLVGYLLAGIAVGPHTPGFVADSQLAAQLAEIGVILLLFGVGLHFHPEELLRVRRIAVPGAIVQSAVATVLGWLVGRAFGWDDAAGLVLGMALAVASTVVLMRMLLEQNRLSAPDGHVAVGWLIVEDIFTVVALVVLPALVVANDLQGSVGASLATALAKVAGFALLIWLLGYRVLSPFLEAMARTRSAELFTLAVFVVALGVAALAATVFEVSVALGAFFAGLVVGQTRVGHQAAADMLPFRDIFTALFFVSVGMLFDPKFVWFHPALMLAVLGIILVAKPLAALAIVLVFRQPARTALTVSVGLAQIGEFSFILGALGKSLGILPQEGFDVLVAGALLSIALNPLLFRAAAALEGRLAVASASANGQEFVRPSPTDDNIRPSVVVVGLAEVGRELCQRLMQERILFVAVDDDLDRLDQFGKERSRHVYGDPGRTEVLRAAGLEHAELLVLTQGALAAKMRTCLAAKQINPRLGIVTSVRTPSERAWLQEFGVTWLCDEPGQLADGMHRNVMEALSKRA